VVARRRPRSTRSGAPVVYDEVTLLRAWLEWLARGRTRYLRAIRALPAKDRRKDRGASFGSVQDVYQHILQNNIWWLECVPNDAPDRYEELVGRDLSEAELGRYTRRVARSARTLARSLTPAALNVRHLVNGIGGDGRPYTMTIPLRTAVWHLLEEELQHRGELNALFWQMEIDPAADAWFTSPLAFQEPPRRPGPEVRL
jgi:uncharacterized damage-inducible protein DinB